MFQIVIAVISIILVAALMLASTYYGGLTFQQKVLGTQITSLVNAGSQIYAAQVLYLTYGGAPVSGSLSALEPAYLTNDPANTSIVGANQWKIIPIEGTNGVAVIKFSPSAPLTQLCGILAQEVAPSTSPAFYCADDSGNPASVSSTTSFAFKL